MATPVIPGPPPPPRRASTASDEIPVTSTTEGSEVSEPIPEPPDSEAPTIARNPLPSFDGVPDPEPVRSFASAAARTATTEPPAAGPSAARGGQSARSAGSHIKAAYGGLCAFIDARREHLPGVVRDRVSSPVLLGVASLAAAALVGGIVGFLSLPLAGGSARRPSTRLEVNAAEAPKAVAPTPASLPVTSARPAAAIAEAQSPAVAPVTASVSEEAALLLGLADRFSVERRAADAVAFVERVLLRHPELRSDQRVAAVLLRTAQSDEKTASNASFALLEGTMAEEGARVLYELWLSESATEESRRRADKWLRSKDFDKVAPLPLYVAVKLRQAKTCEDKHALLGLASAGDRQALDYLREIEQRTTCAPEDLANCYPCMRADNRLTETISKLEASLGGR